MYKILFVMIARGSFDSGYALTSQVIEFGTYDGAELAFKNIQNEHNSNITVIKLY